MNVGLNVYLNVKPCASTEGVYVQMHVQMSVQMCVQIYIFVLLIFLEFKFYSTTEVFEALEKLLDEDPSIQLVPMDVS